MTKDSAWDQEVADRLDGSLVVVGLTYEEASGARQEQFFGMILSADKVDGMTIRLHGQREGELFRLPPDLRSFEPAKPGSYRLRSTGEILVDPDYTAKWVIKRRPN